MSVVYHIPTENVEEFKAKIGKLAERAKKIGAPAIVYTFGAKELVVQRNKTVIEFVAVELAGEAPVINGWSLVAVLQHEAAGNIVRQLPPYSSVPEKYRTAGDWCDHCRSVRGRRDTFLVRSEETGAWKQVGRTCLKDFTGHADPHSIAKYLEDLAGVMDEVSDREGYAGRGSGSSLQVEEYMGHVAAMLQEDGWVSSSRARDTGENSTAAKALSNFCNIGVNGRDGNPLSIPVTEAHTARGAAAVAWAREVLANKSGLSDYEWNLVVAAKASTVEFRAVGILASLLPTYEREMGKEIERKKAAATSKHFGAVKARAVYTLTVLNVQELDGGQWGVSYLHTFVDPAGNRAKWFASRQQDLAQGQTYQIKATVKAHEEYKGIAQTVLTNCAVVAQA